MTFMENTGFCHVLQPDADLMTAQASAVNKHWLYSVTAVRPSQSVVADYCAVCGALLF